MKPIEFPGSRYIGPPKGEEENVVGIQGQKYLSKEPHRLYGLHADWDEDYKAYPFWLTAWKPSQEDLEALNRGEPVYIKTCSTGLPPMFVFTVDKDGNVSDKEPLTDG